MLAARAREGRTRYRPLETPERGRARNASVVATPCDAGKREREGRRAGNARRDEAPPLRPRFPLGGPTFSPYPSLPALAKVLAITYGALLRARYPPNGPFSRLALVLFHPPPHLHFVRRRNGS